MERPPGQSFLHDPWPAGLVLIGFVVLWRLVLAWLVPVTQDEAYYFDWASNLAWGYFDHPPGVALLALGSRIEPGSWLAARLGGVLAGFATLLVLARLYRNSGLGHGPDLWLALLVFAGSLPGLAGGFLTTPDSALALAWALALHESERALRGQRWRWLGVGVAVGLGLLSKYSMVVIGPVLLWAILRADPRALRTPWPYLGGLLALLVFAPNLLWNAHNDWLSLRFQLGHGFATDLGVLIADADSALQGPGAEIVHSGPQGWGGRALSLLSFLGTQLGLWGLMALPILATPWLARRRGAAAPSSGLTLPGRALLEAATWFPLGFFALVSLRSDPEGNWPLMYLLAVPPLLVPFWREIRGWVMAAALGNLLLVSLYGLHAATGILPLSNDQNRVLRETHGFRDLAEIAADLDGPVYAARYQDTAMVRFYRPGIEATQWPGLARPSEYLLGQITPRIEPEEVTDSFWLLVRGRQALEIPGFRVAAHRILIDCPGRSLTETEGSPCASPLHVWGLYEFQPAP